MKPRILLVNDQYEWLLPTFDRKLPCEITYARTAKGALQKNPLSHNVAIIDGSDDTPVDGFDSLSEYLRAKRKDMLIVGTSVCTEIFSDTRAKWQYDDRILFGTGQEAEEVRAKLEEVGFEF